MSYNKLQFGQTPYRFQQAAPKTGASLRITILLAKPINRHSWVDQCGEYDIKGKLQHTAYLVAAYRNGFNPSKAENAPPLPIALIQS